MCFFFSVKQKTAYELRISDWSSDVCSSDLGDDSGAPAEGRKITNIVLMGMGEPLYNYDNVATAMRIAMDQEGLSVSKRKITLSTSGVVPEMEIGRASCRERVGQYV